MATDRTVSVRLKAEVGPFVAGMRTAKAAISDMNNEIDKTNDRTAWLAQGVLALAPAFTTLGAGAVPVISGLVTQMTVGVGAAGTLALAFTGVGDALDALNDYQLDPTTENMEQLNEAMRKLGPAGEEFVHFLDDVGPRFAQLQMTAREGMFPGITEGIEEFMELLPQLDSIIQGISEGIGELAGDAGTSLTSERWQGFFNYLETEAKPILVEMGRTFGNFMDGIAAMIVAFAPLSADFSSGFEDMSRAFADWAHNLEGSAGFQEFLNYVQEAGPKALDFLGSLVMTLVELAEAAAPVGAVALPILTGMLDLLGALANTPFGPIALGFAALTSAWGRLNALAAITGSGVLSKATAGIKAHGTATKTAAGDVKAGVGTIVSTWATAGARTEREGARMSAAARGVGSSLGSMARNAAPVAGQVGLVALSMTDLDDKMGLTNTTALTLAGSLMGPWGAAVGAGVGLAMDFAASMNQAEKSIDGWRVAMASAIRSSDLDAQAAVIEQARTEIDAYAHSLDNFSFGTLVDALTPGSNIGSRVGELGEMNDELARMEREFEKSKNAAKTAGAAIRGTLSGMDAEQIAAHKAAEAQRGHARALQQARGAARTSAEAFVGLGDKLDDTKVSFGQWLRSLERQAEALRNFRVNTQRAAEKGLNEGLIKALHEAGPAGAMRMKQLADASEQQIARANKAWQSQRREVRLFGNEVDGLPDSVSTDVDVTGVEGAIAKVDALGRELNMLPRYQSTTVHTVFTSSGKRFKGGFATGGYTGDGAKHEPRGVVHAGELVIPQEDVQRDWAFLRNRYGHLPGFADGGMVSASQASVSVAAPNVAVGGTTVRVYMDGREFRGMVRTEIDADRRHGRRLDDRD